MVGLFGVFVGGLIGLTLEGSFVIWFVCLLGLGSYFVCGLWVGYVGILLILACFV